MVYIILYQPIQMHYAISEVVFSKKHTFNINFVFFLPTSWIFFSLFASSSSLSLSEDEEEEEEEEESESESELDEESSLLELLSPLK